MAPFSLGRGQSCLARFDMLSRDLCPVQFIVQQKKKKKKEFLKLPKLFSFGIQCGLSTWFGEQLWQ